MWQSWQDWRFDRPGAKSLLAHSMGGLLVACRQEGPALSKTGNRMLWQLPHRSELANLVGEPRGDAKGMLHRVGNNRVILVGTVNLGAPGR